MKQEYILTSLSFINATGRYLGSDLILISLNFWTQKAGRDFPKTYRQLHVPVQKALDKCIFSKNKQEDVGQ